MFLVYELVSTDMSGVQCSKKGLGEGALFAT